MINGLTNDEVSAISNFIDAVTENLPKENESGFYGYTEIQSAIFEVFKAREYTIPTNLTTHPQKLRR